MFDGRLFLPYFIVQNNMIHNFKIKKLLKYVLYYVIYIL
jgi:hypothetical protein